MLVLPQTGHVRFCSEPYPDSITQDHPHHPGTRLSNIAHIRRFRVVPLELLLACSRKKIQPAAAPPPPGGAFLRTARQKYRCLGKISRTLHLLSVQYCSLRQDRRTKNGDLPASACRSIPATCPEILQHSRTHWLATTKATCSLSPPVSGATIPGLSPSATDHSTGGSRPIPALLPRQRRLKRQVDFKLALPGGGSLFQGCQAPVAMTFRTRQAGGQLALLPHSGTAGRTSNR